MIEESPAGNSEPSTPDYSMTRRCSNTNKSSHNGRLYVQISRREEQVRPREHNLPRDLLLLCM